MTVQPDVDTRIEPRYCSVIYHVGGDEKENDERNPEYDQARFEIWPLRSFWESFALDVQTTCHLITSGLAPILLANAGTVVRA